MRFKVEHRDLFTVPSDYYLAHCISADFKLGAGIAKTFDTKYDMRNKLFQKYSNYEYHGGDVIPIDNVFNLVTKPRYFDKPTYGLLRQALVEMKCLMEKYNITKLAIPQLGCGLDRLEWSRVEEIIKDVFADTSVDILVCVL